MEKFDIWCINLRHRTDRREKMEKLFKNIGILDQVQFYTADLHPDGGRVGCFESHYNCITNGTRPYIIIFEDDAELNVEDLNWDKVLKDIEEYLEEYNHFSIGCVPVNEYKIIRKERPEIVKSGFTTTLCYALKRDTVEYISSKLQSHMHSYHIDYLYWEILNQCGYIKPIFKQSCEDSDNPWVNIYWINWVLRQFVRNYYLSSIPRKICSYYYYGLYAINTLMGR